MAKLAISILVHDDFTYIHNALKSIVDNTATSYQIYVVINRGAQENIRDLKRAFPHLNYIINEKSQGFATNHNMVMKLSQEPYIALLNDDIYVKDRALDKLVAYLELNPDVGLVGPQLEFEDGSLQATAYSDPDLVRMIYKISGLGILTHQQSWLRHWLITSGLGRATNIASLIFDDTVRDVEVLKAAAIIVRKKTVDDIGYIDETTKAYGEEIDWNYRMRAKNWRITLIPSARITHFGVQALISMSGWQIIEDRKGILNFYVKHRPLWECLVIRITIILSHLLQALFAIILSPKDVVPHLKTAYMGLTWNRLDAIEQ